VQKIIRATRKVNPGIICLAHGGPIVFPEDTRYIYEHTDAAGFVGASSIERIPIERAVQGAVEEFKGLALKKKK
jgi:predicted TIM-barrel enzyme